MEIKPIVLRDINALRNKNQFRTHRESVIESAVCEYAKRYGALTYKFTSPSRRSVPDRLFLFPKNVVLFIEFKAKDKKPTELQAMEIAKIRDRDVPVYVIDSEKKGVSLIEEIVKKHGIELVKEGPGS